MFLTCWPAGALFRWCRPTVRPLLVARLLQSVLGFDTPLAPSTCQRRGTVSLLQLGSLVPRNRAEGTYARYVGWTRDRNAEMRDERGWATDPTGVTGALELRHVTPAKGRTLEVWPLGRPVTEVDGVSPAKGDRQRRHLVTR